MWCWGAGRWVIFILHEACFFTLCLWINFSPLHIFFSFRFYTKFLILFFLQDQGIILWFHVQPRPGPPPHHFSILSTYACTQRHRGTRSVRKRTTILSFQWKRYYFVGLMLKNSDCIFQCPQLVNGFPSIIILLELQIQMAQKYQLDGRLVLSSGLQTEGSFPFYIYNVPWVKRKVLKQILNN